jgi:hypothetical protein
VRVKLRVIEAVFKTLAFETAMMELLTAASKIGVFGAAVFYLYAEVLFGKRVRCGIFP